MSTEQSIQPATTPPRRFLVCLTCQGWGHVTVHSDGWRTTGGCPVCLGTGERTAAPVCRLCETYGHHESPCVQSQAA